VGASVPAIVTAGDRGAARPIYGESKVYLEVGGRTLVEHVVATLQRVPEVSEVVVIGDSARLERVLGSERLRAELRKPLRVLEQRSNLYENAWYGYCATLPGAGDEGREPASEADRDHQVLYLSGDLPFATPQEVSEFVRRGQQSGCDYAIGMTTSESVALFEPGPGRPGVTITYFNLREARLKQTNLHLARPARIENRHYVQDMYEHRKQREFANMLGLAWRLLWAERGGPTIVFFYTLIHVGGVLDRHGWRRLADWTRAAVSLDRVARALTKLLRTRFCFVVTDVGGCALDVDTEEEYDLICTNYDRWRAEHDARAEAVGGPALPAGAGARAPGGVASPPGGESPS